MCTLSFNFFCKVPGQLIYMCFSFGILEVSVAVLINPKYLRWLVGIRSKKTSSRQSPVISPFTLPLHFPLSENFTQFQLGFQNAFDSQLILFYSLCCVWLTISARSRSLLFSVPDQFYTWPPSSLGFCYLISTHEQTFFIYSGTQHPPANWLYVSV